MPVHLIKLAVGIEDLDHLKQVQKARMAQFNRLGVRTRMTPKRAEELTDGGSLYWVIKGQVRVRQPILSVSKDIDEDGKPFCLIKLKPEWNLTLPRKHRAFQGWRYLALDKAPPDLPVGDEDLPPDMAEDLRELGLL